MQNDYYKTLGVAKNASKDEIKKAFRTLAHKYHPDKKTGDEAKFKELSEAYSILSDDKKRTEYDAYGRVFSGAGGGGQQGQGFNNGFGGFDFSGFQQGGFEGVDLGDIFGDIFRGPSSRSVRGPASGKRRHTSGGQVPSAGLDGVRPVWDGSQSAAVSARSAVVGS